MLKIQKIKKIKDKIESGIDISWADCVFLQDSQKIIKKHFRGDPVLCEWAGTPEQEFLSRQ